MNRSFTRYTLSLHFLFVRNRITDDYELHIETYFDNHSFFQFHNSDDAKKALEQLNGFELAGRPMKVNHVTERSETQQGSSLLDSDEMERAGIDLGESWFVISKASPT